MAHELSDDHFAPPGISTGQLAPGDILLSLGVGNTSEAISAFDGGHYSHASLWTGETTTNVIESTTPHVIEHTLDESLLKHPRRYVDAYRHKTIGANHREVVRGAKRFVGRRYSYGDLALAAVVTATTAWVAETAAQDNFLLEACELNRLFRLDRTKDGKLVTCTELVARSYFEAGVPILVAPEGGERFNAEALRKLFSAIGELGREANMKRGAESQADWRATQARLRMTYLDLAGLSPDESLSVDGGDIRGLSPRTAGGEWGANLVTPRYLEKSPNLELIGRVHSSANVAY